MARKLKDITITRIALVDRGACQEADILIAKRAPDAIRKLVGTPVVAGVNAWSASEERANPSRREMPCAACNGARRDVSVFSLANDSEQVYGVCETCGLHGVVQGNRLMPVPASNRKALLAIEVRKSALAIEASKQARRALREEMGPGFTTDEDTMNSLEVVQKSVEAGRPVTRAEVQRAAEARAEIHFARDGSLSIEKALDLGFSDRAFPFRGAGPDNPTLRELWQQASEAEASPIQKAARESEDEAWSGLERIAERLRAKDPKLSREGAISKAMVTPEGLRYYRAYSKAQQLREDA